VSAEPAIADKLLHAASEAKGQELGGCDLARRCQAQQQAAAADEQFFCDQDSERRTDSTPDDANGPTRERECVESRVVTGPRIEWQ